MPAIRIALAAVFLMLAVTLQTSVLPHIAVAGVTCDLVMIVVVALALSRGAEWGAIAGFLGGLLLDVVPPADHTAGRWALALALSGYVAGLVRRETSAGPVGPLGVALTVVLGAALSLTGYDVVAAIVVIPLVMWVMGRVVPARERRRVLP
jgi:rod shape-determining protein MreD